jgi:hypothetical protein
MPASNPTFLAAITAFLGIATSTHAGLDAAGAARLDALRRAPESAGELIYRGVVLDPRAPAGGAPLYSYERRVARGVDGSMESAHITATPNGDVIITERAQFTRDYALQRFDAVNSQLGTSGTVVLSNGGRHLEYRLEANGGVTTASEDVVDPVVAGPQLHGFILRHWDALAQGGTLAVRMIVLAEKKTYGFDIKRLPPAEGRTSFTITPSSWIVRLAVAPLKVTFDTATRNVVRYEGRVPPQSEKPNGKLQALDARVEHAMAAPVYR